MTEPVKHLPQIHDYAALLETACPGLLATLRRHIENSERLYEDRQRGAARRAGASDATASHLWEHTTHVASLTFHLARAEKLAPLPPVLTALLHDAGKFAGGEYHADNTIEEQEAARIAEQLLPAAGVSPALLGQVRAGLTALYNESRNNGKSRRNRIAALVHDADFLAKFGMMGVAAFFTKATLRGRSLEGALLGYLSKELTYAAALPRNMRTGAGRKLAEKKAKDSIAFFRKLLVELREAGSVDLRVRRLRLVDPRSSRENMEILLAAAPFCPRCHAPWQMAWSTEDGVKCTKLNIEWHCADCQHTLETSFCLPEV